MCGRKGRMRGGLRGAVSSRLRTNLGTPELTKAVAGGILIRWGVYRFRLGNFLKIAEAVNIPKSIENGNASGWNGVG